jgi:uncharacterized membrane protein
MRAWFASILAAAYGLGAASSPVADAAMDRDANRVRALLQQKAGANAPQAGGATPFLRAAQWGDVTLMSREDAARPGDRSQLAG